MRIINTNMLGNILQKLRDKDEKISTLCFPGTEFRDAEAKELAQALADNSSVTSIDLSSNQITDEGTKELAQALVVNRTVIFLNLGNNQISDDGAKELAQALAVNSTLTELQLWRCGIGDAGAIQLAQAIVKNKTLTSLHLWQNQISDVGGEELTQALAINSTLTLLDLSDNQISNALEKQIQSLIDNQQNYKQLQKTACNQLKLGRILLYKIRSAGHGDNLFLSLPLEIREKIVKNANGGPLLTGEQQRLILSYAEGKIAPVTNKLSFFKIVKCDSDIKESNLINASNEDDRACLRDISFSDTGNKNSKKKDKCIIC